MFQSTVGVPVMVMLDRSCDVRGGLEIELRFDGNRIGETDVSAIESVARAVEGGLTFENIDAAENSGPGNGAAETEIGVAGKARDGGPHLEFGRRLDVDIEFDVVEWRIGDGDGRTLTATLE